MNTRDDEMYEAASLYYAQGETMDSIARSLNVSRSTVSRLLRDARDTGVVRITLTRPTRTSAPASAAIQRAFGVTCHVVPVKPGTGDVGVLERVARVASGLLADAAQDATVIGLAWGTTVSAVVEQLPHGPHHPVQLVQLNGGANPRTTGLPFVGQLLQTAADALGGTVVDFPVPAFFDQAHTRELMWQERSVRRVLDVQRRCDVAVFGVGTMTGPLASYVYTAGYLDRDEVERLRAAGVVGDICTVMLREDGTWADIPLNARASGPTPRLLQQIPRRLCVCAGRSRVAPLLGALRAQVATDLIVDDATALALCQRAGLRLD